MATQPAILGTARLGNFRLGYNPAALAALRATRVTVLIAGVLANARVRMAGFTVHDAINDAPNTCSLTVDGTAPIAGQDLRVSVNSDAPRLLFNGTLQTVDETYEGKPNQLAWQCTAVDDLVRLNRVRPFGTWTNVSATTIAHEAFAESAPGFTTLHVEAGLPPVSIIADGSEPFSGFLARLANLFGGYFYVEDLDLHLFLTETTDLPDDIDSTPDRFLHEPHIKMRTDDSQQRTRVYGKGHGEPVLSDIAAAESIVPVNDAAMFNPLGGQAIAGTTPDGAQSEILDYTGVQLGGGGSLVGPGAAPSSAPTLFAASGAGVTTGLHDVTVVFVTASGQSIPGPVATVEVGTDAGISAPSSAPPTPVGAYVSADYPLVDGATYNYKHTYRRISTGGETTGSAAYGPVTPAAPNAPATLFWTLASLPTPPAGYLLIWYRQKDGGDYKECTDMKVDAGVNLYDHTSEGELGGIIPTSNTTEIGNQVAVTAIQIGPSGTTDRELYMSLAGGGARKLALTISNNTADAGTITASDATLTAAAAEPSTDTSGLTQPAGQIVPGSTAILVAGLSPFQAGGGWWFTGTQSGRYTGFTGSSLTGVTGIVQALTYNTVIAAAPALTGVSGNVLPILKGTPVHIWVERNDLAAQAAVIALDLAQGRVSDGVVEHQIIDMRRGEESLIALCDADLQRFSQPIVTVTFDGRDTKLKSGKPITFNLSSPAISATLTLMTVDISEIDLVTGLAPRFHCVASSVSVSLESILRKLLTKAAA